MIAVFDHRPVSFEDFIASYPDRSEHHYELRRGTIVQRPKPKGKHSEITGFLIKRLNYHLDDIQAPYFIPRECIVKIDQNTGYEPDIALVDRSQLPQEPQWNSASVLQQGTSIPLVVEVVSSNWRDDYALKMTDYESLGIAEYWIVDYLGIGGRRYIGSPKQPTISVCTLLEGEYEVRQFRSGDRLQSPTFPALQLSVDSVWNP